MLTHCQISVSEDDELKSQTEFEVVPQEPDDTEMWDVDNLNEDELKSTRIKGIFIRKTEALQSTDRYFD
jgi:AdoMet-dependent rRNA methyltransferase SPB1